MTRQATSIVQEIRTPGIQPTVAAYACPFASHEVSDAQLQPPSIQGSPQPEG